MDPFGDDDPFGEKTSDAAPAAAEVAVVDADGDAAAVAVAASKPVSHDDDPLGKAAAPADDAVVSVKEALSDDFVEQAQPESKRASVPAPAPPKPAPASKPAAVAVPAPAAAPAPASAASVVAANLSAFEIAVQDPVKKTEGMSSYMLYTITNKTAAKTSSSVQRRFNHFVWLFNELTNANPGVIVPPIPDKQALGRFDSEFVDNRRIGLERFLRRVATNPALCKAPELKLFLEADNIEAAIASKKKEKSKGGFFQSLTSSLTEVVANTAQTFAKIPERDEWFENKRGQLEMLESQLKALYKCVEVVVKQRKDLAAAAGEFGESVSSLASSESNKPLANAFTQLTKVQQKIRDLYNEQATQDDLLFGNTVDEYLRTMSSIKLVLQARSKAFAAMQAADKALVSKRETLEKTRLQPSKAAKVSALEKEVEEAEEAEAKSKKDFEDMSKLIREELAKFDDEKVTDFQRAMQAFVESMMETQRKTIELWKEYLPEVQALSQATTASASA